MEEFLFYRVKYDDSFSKNHGSVVLTLHSDIENTIGEDSRTFFKLLGNEKFIFTRGNGFGIPILYDDHCRYVFGNLKTYTKEKAIIQAARINDTFWNNVAKIISKNIRQEKSLKIKKSFYDFLHGNVPHSAQVLTIFTFFISTFVFSALSVGLSWWKIILDKNNSGQNWPEMMCLLGYAAFVFIVALIFAIVVKKIVSNLAKN